MNEHIDVYIYLKPLTPGDILSDGDSGTAFEVLENNLLIWVDLYPPPADLAPPTIYVLISSTGGVRVEEGKWWPVLNGERILYGKQAKVRSPLKLPR